MSSQSENAAESIRKRILDVQKVSVRPIKGNSNWVHPLRMSFVHSGRNRKWDLVADCDDVALVVFNTSRKKLVFVRQFRPAVYCANLPKDQEDVDLEQFPASLGVTLELCAGIVDKNKPVEEIAREELHEECGYDAPLSAFEKIIVHRTGVGIYGTKRTNFYVEVTDDMRVNDGGGLEAEGELIEVVEMSIPEVKEYIKAPYCQSPSFFLFGVYWFLCNKPQHCA